MMRLRRLALLYWAWLSFGVLFGLAAFREALPALDALTRRMLVPLGLVGGMLFTAWAVGRWLTRPWPRPAMSRWEALFYPWLVGMGLWAWLAALLAWMGWLRPAVLRTVSLTVLALAVGVWRRDRPWRGLRLPRPHGWWLAAAGVLAGLSLLPPYAMDALMYHLALPERLLRDHGYRFYPVVHFWFPSLVEHQYVWFLAWGNDVAPRVLHAAYTLLAVAWSVYWSRRALGRVNARYTLWLLLAMPSLFWVGAWAYTDAALSLFTVAALYGLYRFLQSRDPGWLPYVGWATGMALGVKYTAGFLFVGVALVLLLGKAVRPGPRGLVWWLLGTGTVALPWYLRNLWFTGNPVYPFFFGGRGWDAFLGWWYAQPGSGLLAAGWRAWLRFPLELALGLREGPEGNIGIWWWLLALPAGYWVWRRGKRKGLAPLRWATGPFLLLAMAGWWAGALWSRHLQQARLFWPALFPMSLWLAMGLRGLRALPGFRNTSWQRATAALLALFALLNLGTAGLRFLRMDGPAWLLGGLDRQAFYRKHNPAYAELKAVVAQLPEDARVYMLFEPRSYGLPRETVPDTLLAHWPHDRVRYGSPEAVVQAWRSQYTHVLRFTVAENFLFQEAQDPERFPPAARRDLEQALRQLVEVERSPSSAYVLYSTTDD